MTYKRQPAIAVLEKGLKQFPDSENLLSRKYFLHLAQGRIDEAINEAQKALDEGLINEPDALFELALAQLLTGKGEFESTARRFINNTEHPYRDYIRLILYSRLSKQGKSDQAQELLKERWEHINPSTWSARLEHGDPFVWREQFIGYYLGKVPRKVIFGPLQNQGTFEGSDISKVGLEGLSLYGLRCEAYFYDALLQDIKGERKRYRRSLEQVIATGYGRFYEYQMARYLLELEGFVRR